MGTGVALLIPVSGRGFRGLLPAGSQIMVLSTRRNESPFF